MSATKFFSGSMDTRMSVTKWRVFFYTGSMETNMSVTKWRVFLHRLDAHQSLCNKMACFCYIDSMDTNVRNKAFSFTGSIETNVSV